MKKTKTKNNQKHYAGQFLRGSVRYFAVCILASLLASIFELFCPKIISFTVDSVIGSEPIDLPAFMLPWLEKIGGVDYIRAHLWLVAIAVIVVAGLMGVFKYLDMVANRRGAETLVETMRNRLFGKIERLTFSWYSKNQTGDIIQRCTSDIETIKMFLSDQLTYIISTALMIVLSLIFMYDINSKLATVALVAIPVIIIYSALFEGKIGKGFMECDENEAKLSAIVQENLSGVRVVRAFGREKYEVDKYTKQNNYYAELWVKLGRVMSLFWATGDTLSGLQVMTVLIWGTILCVNGEMTLGNLIAIVSYNSMLTWPVRSLGRVISEMSKANVSFSRIDEIMNAEEEQDSPTAVDCDTSGDIVFEDVSFSYTEDKKVLDGISLTVKKGTTLGILGMTGSGKSTLAALLCRLFELKEGEGRITISGEDIKNIKLSSLRKNVGIVLQEPFLFSRTLGENIGIIYANPSEHMEDIRRAADSASLTETVEGFTQGYETMVGERGVTLSGGQKQRVAIARLLSQNTPVMIYDDSLSAVDAETDAKIRAALREDTEDATVIIISHRIQTLMNADNIIVLKDGRIVEDGTHKELIEVGGIYRQISDIQASGLDGEVA